MSKCIVCGINKATIPDRERQGRPVKRLCLECHRQRLKEDIQYIAKTLERKS
jgi:hypothetical protein